MKIAWISALGALLLTVSGCGDDRFIMIGTARAPSTSGFVDMEDQRSDGATILVHLEQLHPVNSVDPAAKFYVVWLDAGVGPASDIPAKQPAALRGASLRAGVLRYNAEQRTGELRTDAPFMKFSVKITAETTDKPSAPSELEVARQDVTVDD